MTPSHRAEVNGRTAPTVILAGEPLGENAGSDTSSSVSIAGGRFGKGYDPRRNTAGRIKKAPTVLDETVKLAHKAKERRRIARAWVDTMAEAGTAPGNRARADFSDRVYGLPKQTLVLERGADPLSELYAGIDQAGGMRQLPPPTDAPDATT
jgi:hypothetical protein